MADRETIEMYQRMWNVMKMTAKEIGQEVGKTRNAVMGAITRAKEAGWNFDIRSPRLEKPPVRTKVTGIKTTKVIKRAKPSPPKKPVPHEVTIIELEQHHCKAVVGRSQHNDLPVYCGGKRLEIGPYCQQHSLLYSSGRKE